MSGDARKFAVDAAVGRAALGAAGVWESAIDGDAVAGGLESESQASATAVESDGDRGDLSEAFPQPGSGWAGDLSVPIGGFGDQWTESSVVCRRDVCAYGVWVFVSGGSDGLVESLCIGVGLEQQLGRGVLCASLGAGAAHGKPGAVDIEHRSRGAVHVQRVHRRGGVGRRGGEHGWERPVAGQPIRRATVAQREVRRDLPGRLWRWSGGRTRLGPMVRGLQPAAAASGVAQCDAGGDVLFGGVVWSQACGLGEGAILKKRQMSLSLWTMDCEIIQKTKARLALVASDGLDASRIPRTVRRSGCAPAEPYPPNRVRSLSKRLDCRQQK